MKRFLAAAGIVSLLSLSVFADDKKKDPDEIGNRNVDKGLNWYSIEKESPWARDWRRKWSARPRSSTIRSSPNT